MQIFLPWEKPLLPAAAGWLLDECAQAQPGLADADLGRRIVVVRGRNAGRRLLGLLAAQAQSRGLRLIPPRILTPGSLDGALLLHRGNPAASRAAQRLAWIRTLKQADAATLDAIWASPSSQDRASALGRFLDETWRELSASGHDFAAAYRRLCQFAPEASVEEEPRWTALDVLLGVYRRCLDAWGLADASEFLLNQGKHAMTDPKVQVDLVGVIELSPAIVALLEELPREPRVLIHAPQAEAAGFDAWGRLVPAYWAKRPCRFEHGEIHGVPDATRQARRCAALVETWRAAGLPQGAVTVAIPEAEALASIEAALADAGIPARRAEGQPASRSPVLTLLAALAEFLESGSAQPPRYGAVARLVRHPDLAKLTGHAARKLDAYFNAHLPDRLAQPCDENPLSEEIASLVNRLRGLARIGRESFADDLTRFLLAVYGERRLNRGEPEDRAVIHSLEAVREALDALKAIPAKALAGFEPSELLRTVIETAGAAGIPAEEAPGAVELAGWLEAAADDAPALIVTSVFEGSLPEGAQAEPLLHDGLRERLGLPCRASRFARDQYTLWTVTESRRVSGRVALIAPRRNATGEPARPSRLLIAGQKNAELAARLIALSTASKPNMANAEPLAALASGPGLQPPEPEPERMRAFRVFSPTCFRTYLESPLLFYFKYVLRLTDEDDAAQELDGGMFGTILHSVLREFGCHWLDQAAHPDAAAIEAELGQLLDVYMARVFGAHALAPVHTQTLALRQRLRLFARHQAAAFAEGWRIVHVESDDSLIIPFNIEGAPADVQLKGKMDRIDWHPQFGWRVIDYKTANKAVTPAKAHFNNAGWKDLQLPLYLKLLPALDLPHGPADPERTELVYFNLPEEQDKAGITEPFPREGGKIEEAWEQAAIIVREVCDGTGCREQGKLSPYNAPAFDALCGANGLTPGKEEEEED